MGLDQDPVDLGSRGLPLIDRPYVPALDGQGFIARVVERLGLPVEHVVAGSVHVSVRGDDEHGFVEVRFALPRDELIELFQAAGGQL